MTEHCEKTAKKHSLTKDAEKLAKKVEEDQSIDSWDFFVPSPFVKKNLGKSFRLVCVQQPIENKECIVISFLACFPRGGSGEYEKFIKKPQDICGKYIPEEQKILDYIESRKDTIPEPPAPPSDIESAFLYAPLESGDNSDMLIYESIDWVEQMKTKKMSAISTRLFDALGELDVKKMKTIQQVEQTSFDILYKWFPNHNSLFLIGIIGRNDDSRLRNLQKKYTDILHDGIDSEEVLIQYSRRSYPHYILADETMWKSIQSDDVGNIALSPEESNILEGMIKKDDDKLYPLFINGRPGSGKSTILQYLFSSYLFLYLNTNVDYRLPLPPLYLTYSEGLLDTAKQTIDNILRCNSAFALHELDLDTDEYKELRNSCYGIFHKFLLKLLPEEKRKNFSPEKKIDFSLFRRLWDKRRVKDPTAEVRNLTAEISWHVIRSYIKGMRYDIDTHFDAEAYSELPSSQQSVQESTFAQVFTNVWTGWYESYCEKHGYWDDQDLVFAVLNTKEIDISKYPAIFCDEAQDFSKLELNLILRLSLYSLRTLPPHELKLIPFAFAGDPFQTLNPTGFDWGSLQANFHEKLITALDKSAQGKLEFNYQELSFNYRSSKYIVGLCNLIQLLRGILFEQSGLTPQRTWFDTESSIPVYFNVKDPLCEKKLREQSELVIILPCQEGEEEKYVEHDVFLSSLAESEVDIRNFLSPMRAKGQEFSRVVLYNFGHECSSDYPELLVPFDSGKSHSQDKDVSLPLKYFMNRLYVAASRAKKRLIIVDDDQGIGELWDNDTLKNMERLLQCYKNAEKHHWDSDVVNYVQKGQESNWSEDRDNPEELAEEFHKAGLAERDPYKLRLAEANYMRCKQENNGKLCRAQRYEMEGNLVEGGKLYLELRRIENALKCFWDAEDYQTIFDTTDFASTPEHRAASFHVGDRGLQECKKFLAFLAQQVSQGDRWKYSGNPQWIQLVDEALEAILKKISENEEELATLYSLIKQLEQENLRPSDAWKCAELAYLVKDYGGAVQYWESKDAKPSDINYFIAKGHTEPFPDNLEYHFKSKNYRKVVTEWQEHSDVKLSLESSSYVFDCLLREQMFDDCLDLLERYPTEKGLQKIYLQLKNESSNDVFDRAGRQYLQFFTKEKRWKEAIQLVTNKSLEKKSQRALSIILTYHIASAEDFNHATLEDQNLAAKFLKYIYIDRKWDNTVPFRVAGAAIENAYKIIDALEFYEAVWKKKRIPATPEDIEYATKRWVKCKLRLADYIIAEGKPGNAGKHRDEAEHVCRHKLNGINKVNIPENPEFDTDNDIIDNVVRKSRFSDIPAEKIKAITVLHDSGMDNQTIATSVSLSEDIVADVIKGKCENKS
jgi:hypothetical protein